MCFWLKEQQTHAIYSTRTDFILSIFGHCESNRNCVQRLHTSSMPISLDIHTHAHARTRINIYLRDHIEAIHNHTCIHIASHIRAGVLLICICYQSTNWWEHFFDLFFVCVIASILSLCTWIAHSCLHIYTPIFFPFYTINLRICECFLAIFFCDTIFWMDNFVPSMFAYVFVWNSGGYSNVSTFILSSYDAGSVSTFSKRFDKESQNQMRTFNVLFTAK